MHSQLQLLKNYFDFLNTTKALMWLELIYSKRICAGVVLNYRETLHFKNYKTLSQA
jgi:uncharacterized membrane protein YqhA